MKWRITQGKTRRNMKNRAWVFQSARTVFPVRPQKLQYTTVVSTTYPPSLPPPPSSLFRKTRGSSRNTLGPSLWLQNRTRTAILISFLSCRTSSGLRKSFVDVFYLFSFYYYVFFSFSFCCAFYYLCPLRTKKNIYPLIQ